VEITSSTTHLHALGIFHTAAESAYRAPSKGALSTIGHVNAQLHWLIGLSGGNRRLLNSAGHPNHVLVDYISIAEADHLVSELHPTVVIETIQHTHPVTVDRASFTNRGLYLC
jgi:hypothetical protein